jgi:hypothetical protein
MTHKMPAARVRPESKGSIPRGGAAVVATASSNSPARDRDATRGARLLERPTKVHGPIPSYEQAFESFVTFMKYLMAESAAPAVYHQDHLPPDCASRDTYLRRHRELRRAGIEGAWMRGKTAACTVEAWSAEITRPKLTDVSDSSSTRVRSSTARDVDDELDWELGITTKVRTG